jgi:hypothetical protein
MQRISERSKRLRSRNCKTVHSLQDLEPVEPKSIQLEYNALIENQTWEPIDWKSVPNGVPIHKLIWKFKIKEDGRYKARLCFDRRFQEAGVDYFDTFASAMQLETFRIIINMTLQNGGELKHLDIPNAFLNTDVDANVYICMNKKGS